MKKIICFALAAVMLSAPSYSRPKKTRDAGLEHLESSFSCYDRLQKTIFGYAETAYKETLSAELWETYLESCGFTVERGVGGIPTAFVATYGSGSPVIGMMAEYDAIAGMSQDTVPYRKPLVEGAPGHACGHNLLGTGSVAGAVALSKWLAEGHKGTIRLFGCPAEEGGGGKAYMMREGVFDGLDAMLDWHPDTRNTVNTQTGLANVQVIFRFHGKSSHASGAPEEGRSALDAVEAFDYMVNMMREHVPQSSRIHYVITDGGKAPNVVPERAEVKYYFRSPSRTVVEDILSRAVKAAEGAAMGTGTVVEYERISGNYERLPNDTMSDLLWRNLNKVGGVSYDSRERAWADSLMAESGVDPSLLDKCFTVVPPAAEGYEAYVSSDVGNVTWAVPTGSFRYACFVPGGVGHSWQQVSSAGTTIGTKGALGAAKVLYLSAKELMTDSTLLAKARDEFLERRGPDFKFEPMMGNRRPPFMSSPTMERTLDKKLISSLASSASSLICSPEGETGSPLAAPASRPKADTTSLTYFIGSKTLYDQASSGRCWYFATMNSVRDDIPFSACHAYFWDMLEKANLFLVEVYDHRNEPLDSRTNEKLFNRPVWDGGHFMNVGYIIEKYGAVPESAMPETPTCKDTGPLLGTIRPLMRKYGLEMRLSSDPEEVRERALKDVYRLLTEVLGTPPDTFAYEGKTYTPESFRDAFIPSGFPGEYAILMNDPTRPYYRTYRVEGSRNAYDAIDWTFLNLPLEDLEAAGVAALSEGVRFYFTCDTAKDALPEEGVYDSTIFPVDSLYGISSSMTREERFLSRDIVSAHAMAMCGVLLDSSGSPVKWVSENSFGPSRGQDGYVEMSADWWRLYMFRMALPERFLPEKTRSLLNLPPSEIPRWNIY